MPFLNFGKSGGGLEPGGTRLVIRLWLSEFNNGL